MEEVIKVEDCAKNIADYNIPIHNAIIIPRGATIGDVITAMFPNLREIEMVLENEDGDDFEVNYDLTSDVSKGWNAPYMGSEG